MEIRHVSTLKNIMRIVTIIGTFVFFWGGIVNAATLYMGPNEKYTNLQAAMAIMSGGDTLIIRDGVYAGSKNVIDYRNLPPSGTSDAYTIIKAENVGKVIFDGEYTRQMCSINGDDAGSLHHIQVEGIQWRKSSASLVTVTNVRYVKIIQCSAFDVVGSGHTDSDGFAVHHCSYVLLEDCWSWGNVRKHFYIGNSASEIVVRRCVVRHDRYSDYHGQNAFMAYDCSNVEFQNCIAIDGDQTAYYTGVDVGPYSFETRYGGGDVQVTGIYYRGCISLGNVAMLGWVGSSTTKHTVTNSIHWGSSKGNRVRVAGSRFDHCTFGKISGTSTWSPVAYLEGGDTITNSIFYDAYYGVRDASTSSNYNAFYAVKNEYNGNSKPGSNDLSVTNGTAVDPIDGNPGNGKPSLKYLVRIEDGSSLDGKANDGGDIGATITHRIGVSGALWGETGFNTTTSTKLWPFPNEDLIRTQMRTYSYNNGAITGNRGFCVDGKTLTKYIWEYLGNAIPEDIYGASISKIARPSVVSVEIAE